MINNNKIRIKDIAKQAGVSVGTVDRVLHNRGEVSEDTKHHVIEIIEKLKYEPNIFARTLAIKKPFKIAVLLPVSRDENIYWDAPYKGIQKAMDELKNFITEVEIFRFNQFDVKLFNEQAEYILDYCPDAAVIVPSFFPDETARLASKLVKNKVPFVFIDSNIENVDCLGYIGQDSYQSGFLAGKILHYGMPDKSQILQIRLAKQNIFSNALIKRSKGFDNYFNTLNNTSDFKISTIDILFYDKNTVSGHLKNVFNESSNIAGIYVPNSKVYMVAEYIEKEKIKGVRLIGHDLLPENVHYLNLGTIDFLIAQNPEEQGYKAITDLFNHLVLKREIEKTHYFPIDIITKENIQFY